MKMRRRCEEKELSEEEEVNVEDEMNEKEKGSEEKLTGKIGKGWEVDKIS